MDLGLGNLTGLKRHLLGAGQAGKTTYNDVIANIGRGVAGRFDTFCCRNFKRVVDDTFTVSADRRHLVVMRYPLESVSKVELREDAVDGWDELTGVVQNLDEAAGLVLLVAVQGNALNRIRITYTGGYWFDDSEDESGSLPTGATALPDELQFAWLLQCERVWEIHDKLGKAVSGSRDTTPMPSLAMLELVPEVKEVLRHYVRYQMV